MDLFLYLSGRRRSVWSIWASYILRIFRPFFFFCKRKSDLINPHYKSHFLCALLLLYEIELQLQDAYKANEPEEPQERNPF